MSLAPYLKLMLEKNAESLALVAGSAPVICISGKKIPVGKNELTAIKVKELAFSLLNDNQKSSLELGQGLAIDHAMPEGQVFRLEMEADSSGITVMITPSDKDKKVEQEQDQIFDQELVEESELEKIQVLGHAPEGKLDIMPYLHEVVKLEASDLFLTVNSPIRTKVDGRIIAMDDYILTPEQTESGAFGIMDQDQIDEFLKTNDLDFAIELSDGTARFRVNAFRQRKRIGLVLRLIPSDIPTIAQLGLPDILSDLIMLKRGLILMVGGTGTGKSTSLASMINHRNLHSAVHILTIEDPVEFSHPNHKSIVNQREVGIDTESYARALKASLREAPDVILIGEIRERKTMEAALELANTGHLCVSTLHANNANQAMERVVNMFPQEYHKQLFMDLSINLRAVISQRLIPDSRNKRTAAIEVMINTPHISNLILKGELNEIKEAMAASGSKGMKTFDDALYDLYKEGRISLEEALKNADSRNNLEAKINFG